MNHTLNKFILEVDQCRFSRSTLMFSINECIGLAYEIKKQSEELNLVQEEVENLRAENLKFRDRILTQEKESVLRENRLSEQAKAWCEVVDHCLELGMQLTPGKTGCKRVKDFISESVDMNKSQKVLQEGVMKQAEDFNSLHRFCKHLGMPNVEPSELANIKTFIFKLSNDLARANTVFKDRSANWDKVYELCLRLGMRKGPNQAINRVLSFIQDLCDSGSGVNDGLYVEQEELDRLHSVEETWKEIFHLCCRLGLRPGEMLGTDKDNVLWFITNQESNIAKYSKLTKDLDRLMMIERTWRAVYDLCVNLGLDEDLSKSGLENVLTFINDLSENPSVEVGTEVDIEGDCDLDITSGGPILFHSKAGTTLSLEFSSDCSVLVTED